MDVTSIVNRFSFFLLSKPMEHSECKTEDLCDTQLKFTKHHLLGQHSESLCSSPFQWNDLPRYLKRQKIASPLVFFMMIPFFSMSDRKSMHFMIS